MENYVYVEIYRTNGVHTLIITDISGNGIRLRGVKLDFTSELVCRFKVTGDEIIRSLNECKVIRQLFGGNND